MSQTAMNQKYIVSDEYKFVYFVVQKVACSSIKTALLPLFDLDTKKYERIDREGTPGLNIHKMFDNSRYQIRREQSVQGLNDRYADYFKFAFVRNPWDRLVSCYTQKLSPKGVGLPHYEYGGIQLYKGMPFAEFVEAVQQISDAESKVKSRFFCKFPQEGISA